MLEILFIYFLGKKLGGLADSKGYSGTLFTVLFVAFWFLGEILGFVVGFGLQLGREGIAIPYLIALVAAGAGALVAFLIVVALPDNGGGDEDRYDAHGYPIPRRRARRGTPTRRRRPRPVEDDYEDEEPERPRRRPARYADNEDEPEPRPRRRRPIDED